MVVLILGYSLYTLASKFGDRVHISLQVESLGLKYSLAYKFGDKVYFILPVHFSHNIYIYQNPFFPLLTEFLVAHFRDVRIFEGLATIRASNAIFSYK